MSQGGNYQAFFTGEPNGAAEDAVEIRTDGRWNDVAHNAAGTARRRSSSGRLVPRPPSPEPRR